MLSEETKKTLHGSLILFILTVTFLFIGDTPSTILGCAGGPCWQGFPLEFYKHAGYGSSYDRPYYPGQMNILNTFINIVIYLAISFLVLNLWNKLSNKNPIPRFILCSLTSYGFILLISLIGIFIAKNSEFWIYLIFMSVIILILTIFIALIIWITKKTRKPKYLI